MQLPDEKTILSQLPSVNNLKHLEQGGQKVVYSAYHKKYGSIVLKVILNPSERTKREIEVAVNYKFANVPKLFEWGNLPCIDGDTIYLIEQFIQGQTLHDYLGKNRILKLDVALDLLRILLETCVELEKYHIVHRDIKPKNIMLGEDGSFWLLDFGIARHLDKISITHDSDRFGPHTAGYAAPEQFRNIKAEIDIRADLFSVGVVIYEALSGEHPFISGARDYLDILRRTETYIPNFLFINGDSQKQLAGFINILMSKYPSRRPRGAEIALNWFNALLPTIKI